MLTIRTEQWNALTQSGLIRFEDEMVQHLSGFAPELAKVMGEPRMHELVRLGIARGQAYGFTDCGPLRFYLETMLALGSDFDTDAMLERATEPLRNPPKEQHARAAALYDGVRDYFEQVNGRRNEHALAAMQRIRVMSYEDLPGGGDSSARALALFRGGFPQKYAYAGETALRAVVARAQRASVEYGARSEAAGLLLASVMFGFGHGATSDPAYTWIADTLRDASTPDAEQRMQVLHRKTRLYLSSALKNLAPG